MSALGANISVFSYFYLAVRYRNCVRNRLFNASSILQHLVGTSNINNVSATACSWFSFRPVAIRRATSLSPFNSLFIVCKKLVRFIDPLSRGHMLPGFIIEPVFASDDGMLQNLDHVLKETLLAVSSQYVNGV